MTRVVVFAYHNVGVRCLSVLLAHGVEIPLVLTHQDNPNETIWFGSVERVVTENRIPCATPEDPNTPDWIERIRALQPDFIFSFYYRHMLKMELLDTAKRGAYNMHGSLLPKYRGRVPVNWAIIRGEKQTGATLHRMALKPDAGDMVGQQAVPILPDDTAADVFTKVTVAAECVLDRALPELIAGTAAHTQLDLAQGSYFGGRKPEDGRIDWALGAEQIHNLVRGVAPPYPGAFTDIDGKRLRVLRSRIEKSAHSQSSKPTVRVDGTRVFADCIDGRILEFMEIEYDGKPLDGAGFLRLFGRRSISPG